MSRFHPWLLPALFAAILVTGVGCGGATTAKSADARTPAQYFEEEQRNTNTPHGRIMPGSVEEKDSKIQYKTEDGKQWRVPYRKQADDTYQYGTPDEVK